MALSPKLELRQSQSLVMTPQLQQAIKLLQLSNLELSGYVDQELERNPFLEREEAESGEPKGGETETARAGESAVSADEAILAPEAPPSESSDLDTDYENLYADRSKADAVADAGPADTGGAIDWSSARGGSSKFESGGFDLEGTLTEKKSLRDHLMDQLSLAIEDPGLRIIGAHLIDMVDEAGYMRGSLEDVADRLGAELDQVEQTLSVLQRFEPTGVFARDLAECLALQLAERNRLDPAMQALLDNLELLARREIAALERLCGVDAEDIADMMAEIRRLNPKPGLEFGDEVLQPVVPDVFVRDATDGGWIVELNSETLPRLLVNQRYFTQISGTAQKKDDKVYLSECFTNANWLVKSLEQRATTILKVATEIIRQQDGFLVHGVQHLRPLNLRTVAEAIGMHESTVSRVTANKYMATRRGVYEMKYFFTSAIPASGGGEAHSAEAVRHRIRELIDNETAADVLSDDRIVEMLKESGIDIARRTVAKYREALRIPSSVQRRRLKRLSA